MSSVAFKVQCDELIFKTIDQQNIDVTFATELSRLISILMQFLPVKYT